MGHRIQTIKLIDGDIDLSENRILTIEGADAVIQNIESILSIRKGEFFLNTNLGLNHTNLIAKNPDLDLLRLDVIQAITQENNVDVVNEVTITLLENRQVKITFVATLINQLTIESEVII